MVMDRRADAVCRDGPRGDDRRRGQSGDGLGRKGAGTDREHAPGSARAAGRSRGRGRAGPHRRAGTAGHVGTARRSRAAELGQHQLLDQQQRANRQDRGKRVVVLLELLLKKRQLSQSRT